MQVRLRTTPDAQRMPSSVARRMTPFVLVSQAVEASARRCQDAVERGRRQPAAACAGSWHMQAP